MCVFILQLPSVCAGHGGVVAPADRAGVVGRERDMGKAAQRISQCSAKEVNGEERQVVGDRE
jgi:hypothetical protein